MEQMPNYFPLLGIVIELLVCVAFIYLAATASNKWLKLLFVLVAAGIGIMAFSKLSSAISSAGANAPTVPKSNTSTQAPQRR